MEIVDEKSPPKSCDYFHLIGGPDIGGSVLSGQAARQEIHLSCLGANCCYTRDRLIEIMLGRLKISVVECIEAYVKLFKRVFEQMKSRISTASQTQRTFGSEELTRAVKSVMLGTGEDEDKLLKDAPKVGCMV